MTTAQLVLAQSGEEALRQVLKHEFAERSRRTPIIFMSANEDRRKQPRSDAAEEHYWRKPLVPERVRSKVMTLVGNAHGQHHQLA